MATSFSSIAMLLLVTSVLSFTEATNCGGGSYEGDSAYESHLNSVKAELKQGYTSGQRINPDVYGEAVCYVDQKVCIAFSPTLVHCDYASALCSSDRYETGDKYNKSLNYVKAQMRAGMPEAVAQWPDVYGFFVCAPDSSMDTCLTYVRDSLTDLEQACPNSKGAQLNTTGGFRIRYEASIGPPQQIGLRYP